MIIAEGLGMGWQILCVDCALPGLLASLTMAAIDFKDRHCLGREAPVEACFWKGAGDSLKKDKGAGTMGSTLHFK